MTDPRLSEATPAQLFDAAAAKMGWGRGPWIVTLRVDENGHVTKAKACRPPELEEHGRGSLQRRDDELGSAA